MASEEKKEVNSETKEASTDAKEEKLTLHEELKRNWREAKEEADKPEEEVAEEVEDGEEITEEVNEEESAESEEEGTEEAEQVVLEEVPVIPNEWPEEEKAAFQAALDNPDLAEPAKMFMERYENLKKGFYKQGRDNAEVRKSAQEWDNVFTSDMKTNLQASGLTPQSYIKTQLLPQVQQFTQDPKGWLKLQVQQLGLSPEDLGFNTKISEDKSEDEYVDPDLAQMKARLATLEGENLNSRQSAVQQQQAAIQNQIQTFKEAKDDKGNIKYPHFTAGQEEMGVLLNTGKAASLEDAYVKSPTVKQLEMEEKNFGSTLEEELVEKRKKASKAKKSSKSVKAGTNGAPPTEGMSLKEELMYRYNAAG